MNQNNEMYFLIMKMLSEKNMKEIFSDLLVAITFVCSTTNNPRESLGLIIRALQEYEESPKLEKIQNDLIKMSKSIKELNK